MGTDLSPTSSDSAPSKLDDSHTVLNCMPKNPSAVYPDSFGVFSFHFSSYVPATSKKLLIKHATSISFMKLSC